MSGLALTLIGAIIWSAPRQLGRWLAKVRIGYLAQLRDEGHDP